MMGGNSEVVEHRRVEIESATVVPRVDGFDQRSVGGARDRRDVPRSTQHTCARCITCQLLLLEELQDRPWLRADHRATARQRGGVVGHRVQ